MYPGYCRSKHCIMDGVQYDAKQQQHSIICIQPDSDTDGYDSDVYCAEWEHSAHRNGDIQPDEDITDQMTASATSLISESDTTERTEIYKFHTKLAQMAEHLADITTATLRQCKFTEEDVEFSCLIRDCGDELAGMGEFLIEVANTISENVSVEMPEVIEISNSDDDTPVTNEILNTVQDSVRSKMTSAKNVSAITTSSGLCREICGKMSWWYHRHLAISSGFCNQYSEITISSAFCTKTKTMYWMPCQQTQR